MRYVTVVSFNGDHIDPLNFSEGKYQYVNTGITDRLKLFPEIVSQLRLHVICLQELFGRSEEEVQATLRELARMTGMDCEVDGQVAAKKSFYHNLGTGFLWKPGTGMQAVDYHAHTNFWHPLSQLRVKVGGQELTYFSYHGQPVGKVEEFGDVREAETERVVAMMRDLRYAVLAGDFCST